MRASIIFSPIVMGIIALIVIIVTIFLFTGTSTNFVDTIQGAITNNSCPDGQVLEEGVCVSDNNVGSGARDKLSRGASCNSATHCAQVCGSGIGRGTFSGSQTAWFCVDDMVDMVDERGDSVGEGLNR